MSRATQAGQLRQHDVSRPAIATSLQGDSNNHRSRLGSVIAPLDGGSAPSALPIGDRRWSVRIALPSTLDIFPEKARQDIFKIGIDIPSWAFPWPHRSAYSPTSRAAWMSRGASPGTIATATLGRHLQLEARGRHESLWRCFLARAAHAAGCAYSSGRHRRRHPIVSASGSGDRSVSGSRGALDTGVHVDWTRRQDDARCPSLRVRRPKLKVTSAARHCGTRICCSPRSTCMKSTGNWRPSNTGPVCDSA